MFKAYHFGVIHILAGLPFAILQLRYPSILLASFIFYCFLAPCSILPLLFLLFRLPYRSLLLSAIFNSSRYFHRCRPFCHCSARQQISQLFIQGWTFLLLGCRFCSGPVVAIFILLLKMLSLQLQVAAPVCLLFFVLFFDFLVVVFSCCLFIVAVPIVTVQPIAIHIL